MKRCSGEATAFTVGSYTSFGKYFTLLSYISDAQVGFLYATVKLLYRDSYPFANF